MKAIILAGGKGTRLRPLTNNIPKPMVPIIDKPILEYIIELLVRHGITDIALALGYRSENIVSYFGSGRRFGADIEYIKEDYPLGTAGAVKNAEFYLDDDFIVMSGDTLTNLDISGLVAYHMRKGGLVTMATKRVENPLGLGIVKCNENGRIVDFVEKPLIATSNTVNLGIYAMKREVLDSIPPHTFYDFSRDLFPTILPYMYGYFSHCYWSDIGTLSSYYLTNHFVATNMDAFGLSL